MSQVPFQVLTRPFAVEPVTNMMLPDGIFDNAIFNLIIACHCTNQSSATLTNVTIYLESVGDPGIAPVGQTFTFDSISPGASVLVKWSANFQNASPGKPLVSFVAQADGFDSRRSIQQIFVSQTRYDTTTKTYTCAVPEGALKVSNIRAIASANSWGAKGTAGCCSGAGGKTIPGLPIWIPTGVTLEWAPNPSYSGLHGELPFSDPWWKILAFIVAVIAAIVAIVEAVKGKGAASASAGGSFDENQPSVSCCTPAVSEQTADDSAAGAAAAVAIAAAAVALSDAADPFWRGQENTPVAPGEITLGEKVDAKWDLPNPPNAGEPYTADVQWTYHRYTSGNTYTYSVSETQTNIHVCGNVELDTPAVLQGTDEPLWVRAKFFKSGSTLYKGSQLYAFAALKAPNDGPFFVIPLTDDGLGFDPAANDGIYAGSLNLSEALRELLASRLDVYGVWRVFAYAQDVNLTQPGTLPQIAAQHIGGFFVASALHITFDPSLPCPLKAQATVTVT
jgi:hypothetical protein